MAKRDILKRSHPYYNKKEVLEKAEELERRAKNLYKVRDDFENEGMDSFNKTRAELYDKAGEHYLNAKRPRKAIFCYKKAAEDWELLNSITGATQFELRHGVKLDKNSPSLKLQREYGNHRDKDLKNAERLKKTLKGKWHGLEGKSISGGLGIVGILGSKSSILLMGSHLYYH